MAQLSRRVAGSALWEYLTNTTFVTILGVFAEVVSSTLVAYGFSRYWFPKRRFVFVLLATMMLPFHVTLIPTYMILKNLKLLDTFDPLVLLAWTARGPFYVFLLRQFFMGIPRDLEEAATIDGANVIRDVRLCHVAASEACNPVSCRLAFRVTGTTS